MIYSNKTRFIHSSLDVLYNTIQKTQLTIAYMSLRRPRPHWHPALFLLDIVEMEWRDLPNIIYQEEFTFSFEADC